MIIKIERSDKNKLNVLISYYRRQKQKENDRFNTKNFVLDKMGLSYISNSSLSKIENNRRRGHDSTYILLLEKLQMEYYHDEEAHQYFSECNKKLLQFAERNKTKKIIKLIDRIREKYKMYSKFIIYKEIMETYDIIYNYYRYYNFNANKIDKVNALMDIMEDSLKPIIIEITYLCYSRINIDRIKVIVSLNKVTTICIESIIVDYLNLLLLQYQHDVETLIPLSEVFIDKCKYINNKIYLCKIYTILATAYYAQDPEQANTYLKKAINEFDKRNDRKENLSIYHMNLAMYACCHMLHYEMALIHFDKCFRYDYFNYYTIFPYYIYVLEQTQHKKAFIQDKIIQLKSYEHIMDEAITIHIFHLLEIKYLDASWNLTNIVKQFYRVKNKNKITKSLYHILDYEVYEVCKQQNNDKLYQKFVEHFQK